MKILVPILLACFALIACANDDNNKFVIDINNDSSTASFAKYFSNIDTTKGGNSVGCSAGYYKLINNKYAIHLVSDLPIQYDSCYNLSISTSHVRYLIELLVFDNNDAHLGNVCTDLFIPRSA